MPTESTSCCRRRQWGIDRKGRTHWQWLAGQRHTQGDSECGVQWLREDPCLVCGVSVARVYTCRLRSRKFKVNAAVMGFGQNLWLGEAVACFDTMSSTWPIRPASR